MAKKAGDYEAQSQKLKEFLTGFTTHDEHGNKKFKYAEQLLGCRCMRAEIAIILTSCKHLVVRQPKLTRLHRRRDTKLDKCGPYTQPCIHVPRRSEVTTDKR